jgi:17beta-estradiol 17-dehydrogenase / very-long-chain 3-oxoacyl-CoA reductase
MVLDIIVSHIPKAALVGFAGIGAFAVASKVISYVQLLLSLFVLPGTNACLQTKLNEQSSHQLTFI